MSAQLSPDGRWFWDGSQWQSALSPDGRWFWDGGHWLEAISPDGRFQWEGQRWVVTNPPSDVKQARLLERIAAQITAATQKHLRQVREDARKVDEQYLKDTQKRQEQTQKAEQQKRAESQKAEQQRLKGIQKQQEQMRKTEEHRAGEVQRAEQRRLKDAEAARKRKIKELDKQLSSAKEVHARAIREARQSIEAREREWAQELSRAETLLTESRDPRGPKLAEGFGVTLHQYEIQTPHGTGTIVGVTARVDTSGEVSHSGGIEHSGNVDYTQRVTATRLVLLGPFALAAPKKTKHDHRQTFDTRQLSDTRQVTLHIDGPRFSSVVSCGPTAAPAALDLATRINNAALQAPDLLAQRPLRIKACEDYVSAVRANTEPIEDARAALAATESDPQVLGSIQHMTLQLDALAAPVTEAPEG